MHALRTLGIGSALRGGGRADIVAGVTLAAMAIPEALGYSLLAGMPPVTGLWCMLVPVVVYALVASSRQLVIGPDSATAPLVLAAVLPLAALGTPRYAALVALLSLLVGLMLLVVYVARLGVLADFLSRPVLTGFLAGIGVAVVVSQLPALLGVETTARTTIPLLVDLVRGLDDIVWPSLALGALTIAVIVAFERYLPRWPGQLVAVILAVLLALALDLRARGVVTLGAVDTGLPDFMLPLAGWRELGPLLVPAFAIVVIVIAQTVATAESYAFRRRYRVSPARDILGLGLANAAAGFSGTYCVNGSATKTAVADAAGGRSQVVSLVMVVAVVAVLLAGTGVIALLPSTAIAAVVIVAGWRLVDVAGLRSVLRVRPWEFAVALIGAAGVVLLSITYGFLIAVALSIIDRMRIAHVPSDAILGEVSESGWHDVTKRRGALAPRGMMAYRFSSSLYFPNATRFHERVLQMVDDARTTPRWFVLDASAVSDVDYTAGQTLLAVADELQQRGVVFAVAEVTDDLRELLARYGLVEKIGAEHVFDTLDLAAEAYVREPGSRP